MREAALCIFCKGVMSWLCLAYRRKHALYLIKFVGLSFRSFFGWSSWFAADNWIRSLSRPLIEDHVYTNLACVFRQSWRPGFHFGVLIWVQLWNLFCFHFWACWEPHDFVFNLWEPKRYLQMEPKQGPKLDRNQQKINRCLLLWG